MRVVWAEDTESDRFLIETALGPGVDVVFAEDGRQIQELVRAHRPALTVLDLKMPRVDGITALRRLRGDADLARSRVVVFSSSHQPEEVDEARVLGAVAYVQKPIGFGPFQAAVKAIAALATAAAEGSVPAVLGQGQGAAGGPGRAPDHGVVFWESEDFLVSLVDRFLDEGKRAGHGLIVLATPKRIERLKVGRGDEDALWLDTDVVFAAIDGAGGPDPQRFGELFKEALATASDGGRRPVSCFGELVTVLHQRGHSASAVAIEAIGQGAAHAHPDGLSILCGYPLAVVAANQGVFDQICALHTHVTKPARDRRWEGSGMLVKAQQAV